MSAHRVFVYALRSSEGQYYVGLTKDIGRRWKEHSRRQSPSVKRLIGELKLVHLEEFPNYTEARRREIFLKSGAGRRWLESHQNQSTEPPTK